MIRSHVLRTVLLALTVTAAVAQTPAPGPAVLTLEDAVARALAKNFDLQIQQLSRENAKDSVIVAESTYDPVITASTLRSGTRSATTTSFVDSNGNIVTSAASRQQFADTRLAVSQRINTGATITASGSLDRSKRTPSSSRPNPAYNGDLSLSVDQPLLRGAGSAFNRSAIERARLDVTRTNLDFKSTVLAVVREVESAYFNLVYAREQLAVYKFTLELAQRLQDENEAKKATGVATNIDVLAASVGVANARRNILLGEQNVRNREDALLALIGQFEFNTPVGEILFQEDPVAPVSYDRSFKLALDNQPDYAASKILIEQFKIDQSNARRNQLPQLDLGGAVGYSGTDDAYDSAARNTLDGDGYNWQVDLSLSIPWGKRADNARYRQASTNLRQQESRLRQLEQGILTQVRSAVRAVETNQETVRISALATELSRKQYELEKARFDAGLSTSRFVLDAQGDLENARVAEFQSRVNLRVALAVLAELEGSSLERYKITLTP